MGAARLGGAAQVASVWNGLCAAKAPMHQVVLVLSVDHLCLWLRLLDTEEEAGRITSAHLVLIRRGLLRHDRRSLWWRGGKGKAGMELREVTPRGAGGCVRGGGCLPGRYRLRCCLVGGGVGGQLVGALGSLGTYPYPSILRRTHLRQGDPDRQPCFVQIACGMRPVRLKDSGDVPQPFAELRILGYYYGA